MQVQELVGIIPWTFVAQICNLFIQMYLIKRFLFKPVHEILEKRRAAADAEIIQAVNNALAGMKQEYLLSQDNVSVTRLPGDSACDVLNTKTMFHYWLNSKGELSFPPQAYYASKHLTIGRYNFDMGVFFAGQLEIFGQKIKVMFSSVNDKSTDSSVSQASSDNGGQK